MKKMITLLSVLILTVRGRFAQTDYDQIIMSVDELQNFDDMDISMIVTMVSQKPGEDKSVMKLQLFRRDSEEKALFLFLKPEVDKGQGFLSVGDNAWMYDPSSRKFSHFSQKENIGDSDAQNGDMQASSLSEDYDITATEDATLGKIECHLITLEANNNEVTTPKLKLWIRKDNNLPLKAEDYSLSDRKVKTTIYRKWTKVGGKYINNVALGVVALSLILFDIPPLPLK